MTPEKLAEIEHRYNVAVAYPGPVTLEESATDVPALLALVREQAVQIEKVRVLADELDEAARTYSEFPLRDTADRAAMTIRAALTATEPTQGRIRLFHPGGSPKSVNELLAEAAALNATEEKQ